jgi:hypothetical protein
MLLSSMSSRSCFLQLAVIRMLQNGGKGLQKAPWPVFYIQILYVIAHRQLLPFNDFSLFGIGKRLPPLFGSNYLHTDIQR